MYSTIDPLAARRTGFADPLEALPSHISREVTAELLRRHRAEASYAARLALDGYGSVEVRGPEPRKAGGLVLAAGGSLAATYSLVKLASARTPEERDAALASALFSAAVTAFGLAVA